MICVFSAESSCDQLTEENEILTPIKHVGFQFGHII